MKYVDVLKNFIFENTFSNGVSTGHKKEDSYNNYGNRFETDDFDKDQVLELAFI